MSLVATEQQQNQQQSDDIDVQKYWQLSSCTATEHAPQQIECSESLWL